MNDENIIQISYDVENLGVFSKNNFLDEDEPLPVENDRLVLRHLYRKKQ